MQLRLTPAGEALASQRKDHLDRPFAGPSLCGLDADAVA
jgi:hypothetical protein